METRILKVDEKAKIDNLIDAVRSEKNWTRRVELFLTLYAECGIEPNRLVMDDRSVVPLSMYVVLMIGDTVVSDAFFKHYASYIEKSFDVPGHDYPYSYLGVFYGYNNAYYGLSTDNMIGAIFALCDLSFLKELKKEGISWSNKAATWLAYLSNQIDNYMEDGEEKELFREKIYAELTKANEDLLLRKKQAVMEHVDFFFAKLKDIDDHMFYREVNNIFGNKMSTFLSNENQTITKEGK